MVEGPSRNITPEQRRLNGAKGAAAALVTKRKKRDDPMFAVRRALPALMNDLLHASRGEGVWKALPLQQRLMALQKCIEYGLGKPVGVDKTGPKDVASEGGGTESAGTLEFE